MEPGEVDSLVKRLVHDPHDEEALAYAHSKGASDPRGYALLLEKVGLETPDPAYSGHWLSEAANVWMTTLGDAHRAARVLMAAIERDPTQHVAAARLAQLYREKGDVKALAGLLDRRAKALTPLMGEMPELVSEVVAMHEELGRLCADPQIGQPKKALESFRRAMELDPHSAYAIYNARELLKALGAWNEVFPLYDRERALEQDPERKIALLRDEAQARRSAGDLVGITRVLEAARQLDPSDAALQQEYAGSVLDRVQAGEPVNVAERVSASHLLVSLAESFQGDHGMAYASAALDLQPGSDRALAVFANHARALGKPSDLATRYASYLDANPEGSMAREARFAVAESYAAAGNTDRAAATLDPIAASDDEALARLEVLRPSSALEATRAQRPASPERASTTTTGTAPASEDLLKAAAKAASDDEVGPPSAPSGVLVDPSEVELVGDDTGAHPALSQDANDATGATGVTGSLAHGAPAGPGSLLGDDVGDDVADAIDMLAAAPGHGVSPSSEGPANNAPSTLPPASAGTAPGAAAAVASLPATAAPALAPVSSAVTTPAVAARVAEPRPAVATQLAVPPAELNALLASASARAKAGENAEALTLYKQVLAIDPAHPEAVSFAEDHLRAAREYADLYQVLLACVRVTGSHEGSLEATKARLREIAGVCEGNLRDLDGAVSAYKQLFALDRSDTTSHASLTRLLERASKWDDLAVLYEQEAAQSADLDSKIALEKKLAALHEEKRHDKAQAGEAWSRVARLIPDDERALDTAARLFEEAGRKDRAAETLQEGVASITEEDQRAAFYERLGELLEAIGQHAEASLAYESAVQIEKRSDLWEKVERAASAGGRFSRAAAAAEGRATFEEGDKERAAHKARAAEHHAKGGDAEKARAALEEAHRLDPDSEAIALALAARHEAAGGWVELVGLWSERAARLSGDRAIEARRNAARVADQKLGDSALGATHWKKIAEAREDEEALARLAELAERDGDIEGAARLVGRLAAQAQGEARLPLAMREAALLAGPKGDVATAIARYEAVLNELDPKSRSALAAIGELEERRGDPRAAARALERELALTGEPGERAELQKKLASLLEAAGDLRGAIAALEAVLEWNPEDLAVLDQASALAERAEAWDKSATFLELRAAASPGERHRLERERAKVLEEKLGRGQDALAVLEPLGDAGDEAARGELVALADRIDKPAYAAAKLAQWWEATPPGPLRGKALKEAFTRYAKGGKEAEALRLGLEIVRSQGADGALASELEGLAERARDLESLQTAQAILAKETTGLARAEELLRQAEVQARAGIPRGDALQHGELGLAGLSLEQAEPLLARLAALAETKEGSLEVYERHVSRLKAPADRLAGLARASQVAASHGLLARTSALFELALGGAPSEDVLALLESSARDGDEKSGGTTLRRSLASALAQGGGGARDGGRTKSALLRRAARLAHKDLGDVDQAFAWMGDSLIAHAEEATVADLEAFGKDDPKRVDAALGRALAEVYEGPVVRLLLGRRAKLRRETLADLPGAAADLKKLHELSPGDKDILDDLAALYRQLGDLRALVQLYEDQILRGKDIAARAELARQVARMWDTELADSREAADAWRRVLRMKAGDPEATAGLERAKSGMLKKPAASKGQVESPAGSTGSSTSVASIPSAGSAPSAASGAGSNAGSSPGSAPSPPEKPVSPSAIPQAATTTAAPPKPTLDTRSLSGNLGSDSKLRAAAPFRPSSPPGPAAPRVSGPPAAARDPLRGSSRPPPPIPRTAAPSTAPPRAAALATTTEAPAVTSRLVETTRNMGARDLPPLDDDREELRTIPGVRIGEDTGRPPPVAGKPAVVAKPPIPRTSEEDIAIEDDDSDVVVVDDLADLEDDPNG